MVCSDAFVLVIGWLPFVLGVGYGVVAFRYWKFGRTVITGLLLNSMLWGVEALVIMYCIGPASAPEEVDVMMDILSASGPVLLGVVGMDMGIAVRGFMKLIAGKRGKVGRLSVAAAAVNACYLCVLVVTNFVLPRIVP